MKRTAFLLAMLALTACGDSTGPADVAGVYTLRTVDGQQLPAVILGDEFTSGSLSLGSNGTFSFTFTLTPAGGLRETHLASGTFTVTDLALSFLITHVNGVALGAPGRMAGSYGDGTISITDAEGKVFVFGRS